MANPSVASATAAAGVLTPQPCTPTCSIWIATKTDVCIEGEPALLTEDMALCPLGAGVIVVKDSGQVEARQGQNQSRSRTSNIIDENNENTFAGGFNVRRVEVRQPVVLASPSSVNAHISAHGFHGQDNDPIGTRPEPVRTPAGNLGAIASPLRVESMRDELTAVATEIKENAAREAAMRVVWPTPGVYRTTDIAGIRRHPVNPNQPPSYHSGIDIAAPMNTPVLAMMAGEVVFAKFERIEGNHIIIRHANGFHSSYQHLNSFAVAEGDTVKAGDVIGYVGTTGSSTGAHLHFEVRRGRLRNTAINPLEGWNGGDRRTTNSNPLFNSVRDNQGNIIGYVPNENFSWEDTSNNIWR